jgi:DNA sulfur modification protein DndB
LNFQQKPRFDLAMKSEDKGIQFGYLFLPSKYKGVKVIDGQHRLFGCALLRETDTDPNLFFVAFEGISGSEEAALFATINKEQQKVHPRLLDELDGELKWDSDNLSDRVQAICSRAIDLLNAKYGSPFEDKVVSPGINTSEDRPLTLPEIRKGMISSGLLGRSSLKENWLPGAYFCAEKGRIDNLATLDRLMDGLDWYFSQIRAADEERWDRGREGRICNNFGIPGHIRLLGELMRHIEHRDKVTANEMSLKQLNSLVEPFLKPIIQFISTANDEQFEERFNVRLGSGGVKQYYFALSKCVNVEFPEFLPVGFEQWLSDISKEEQEKADKDAKLIQATVHSAVVEKLRQVYGPKFFDKAISNKEIQVAAHKKRLEDDDSDRGEPEKYLDFLDLKKIVEQKRIGLTLSACSISNYLTNKRDWRSTSSGSTR